MDLTGTWRDRRQRALMALARSGQERAFRQLYRELYPAVCRFVEARVKGGDEAEDVVSTIFHRFLANLDRYDPERGSVWTWVFTLARHAVIDHARSRKPSEPLDAVAPLLADGGDDPLERLVQAEEDRLIHGVLRDEPAEVREIFALHFADGLRYREIAQVLGTSEAAVKQRFSRTMRRLRGQRSGVDVGGEHAPMGIDSERRVEDLA